MPLEMGVRQGAVLKGNTLPMNCSPILDLMKETLQSHFNVLQIPKRIYSLEELRLNKIEAEKFLSPKDDTLGTVRTLVQVFYCKESNLYKSVAVQVIDQT